MQFNHFQLEIAFKSPEMHFKNGIWPTVEVCISQISLDLVWNVASSSVEVDQCLSSAAGLLWLNFSGGAFHITSNSRYGASNLACIVPTVHNFHKTSNYPSAPNSFPRKHPFSFLGLLVKAREIVQWDPFNITKRIFPDLCISFVFATTIH